jgi:predicted nucleic acid-binding protein
MRQPLFFVDRHVSLVADTSVIINLNATGLASEVLRTLNVVLLASTVVRGELIVDRNNGRHDGGLAADLVASGQLEFREFDEQGEDLFEALVTGSAEATLDDGEAATLALAMSAGLPAAIDERKANRIAAERFPEMRLLSTAELLSSEILISSLGVEAVATAVFTALRDARMAVPELHHPWVADLLGEKISECRSLPASLRQRS